MSQLIIRIKKPHDRFQGVTSIKTSFPREDLPVTFRQRVGPPASLPEGDVVREPGHRHPRRGSKPAAGAAAGGTSWAGRLMGTCVLLDVSVCVVCAVSGGACMIYGVCVGVCRVWGGVCMVYGVYVSKCVCVCVCTHALTSQVSGPCRGTWERRQVGTGGLGPWAQGRQQGCALSDDHKTQAPRETGPNRLPAQTRRPDMPTAGPRLSLDSISWSSRGHSWVLRCALPLAGSRPPPS